MRRVLNFWEARFIFFYFVLIMRGKMLPLSKIRFAGTKEDIASILYQNRRPFDKSESPMTQDQYNPIVLNKIDSFVSSHKPIHMVIPAFPFKSKSPQKTIGLAPDKAEEISITHLNKICESIKHVYSPGAKISIYTDGHIFTPVLPEMTDRDADLYTDGIKQQVKKSGADSNIAIVSLPDLAQKEGISVDTLRTRIMKQYSESIETIKKRIKSKESTEEISNLCGLTKFRYEEIKAQKPSQTNCRTQKEAKEQGYQTLRTSDAWSRFMEASAPEAIRLSSHPKPRDSQKIGIRLSAHGNNSCAPWQSTAAKTNLIPERYNFMKREDAEKLGLQLQYQDGKPSHFEIPEKLNNALVMIQKQMRGFLTRRRTKS